MGNLYRWCLACVLAFILLNHSAFAGTYSASNGYYVDTSSYWGETPIAACEKWAKAAGLSIWKITADGSAYGRCDAGIVSYNNLKPVKYPAPYCAQGGTLSGSTCTKSCDAGMELQSDGQCKVPCSAGYDRNANGDCVKDCTAKAGQPTTNGTYQFSGATTSWSVSECRVYCPQRTISAYGGFGYNCKYTGASADPGATSGEPEPPDPEKLPPEKPDDCLKQGQGYILSSTGKVTCVPSSDAPEGQKPSAKQSDSVKESGKQNPDGTYDKTSPDYKKEDVTTSQGSDGTTTQKKTETIAGTNDGNGNYTCPTGYTKNADNTCTKVTTTQQTNSAFCEQNPNASVCKESKPSSFGGSCDAGFTCDGDAAACASAKASWDLACSFKKTTSTSDFGQQLIDGQDIGNFPNPANPDSTLNLGQLQYTDTSGSCLPDLQFNMLGRSLTVPTQGICNIGGWLGNIGVALSLLIAGFIIVGGIKTGV